MIYDQLSDLKFIYFPDERKIFLYEIPHLLDMLLLLGYCLKCH